MYIIQDKRFCSVEVQIHFISSLGLNLSVRNIVKDMICDSSLKYNSKQKMRLKLDDMYGASLKSHSRVSGLLHDISFSGNVIHDNYTLNNEPNIQEYLNFLKYIIYYPNFTEIKFNEIKQRYLQRLNRLSEDVESFSIKQTLLRCHPNSILNIDSHGDIEIIKKLTLDDVKQAYSDMVKNDTIRVYIAGEIHNIDFISNKGKIQQASYLNSPTMYREEKVIKNSDQSFINLVYNTNIQLSEENFFIGLLTNVILGGQDGLLFKIVREKYSLCYVIYSELYQYDGIVLIHSGVNKTNIEFGVNKIKEVVDQMKQGLFSDDVIDKAKTQIINALKIGNDTLSSKIGKRLNNELRNINLSDEDKITKILSVNKQDIINCINKWKEMYLYVVEGESHE